MACFLKNDFKRFLCHPEQRTLLDLLHDLDMKVVLNLISLSVLHFMMKNPKKYFTFLNLPHFEPHGQNSGPFFAIVNYEVYKIVLLDCKRIFRG